jgi:acid phosphatase
VLFRSAGQQRCVDTATFFARGYMSQGNYMNASSENRATVIALSDSASGAPWADSLTPSSSCLVYSNASSNGGTYSDAYRALFRPDITKRLNKLISGDFNLTDSDIGVMQDLCGFGYEVSGEHRFCDVFEGICASSHRCATILWMHY